MNILFNSLASADLVDGKSFFLYLEGSDHENINSITGFYDGYISGVADSTVNVNWCPPYDFKRSQLLGVIVKYYKDNPSYSEEVFAPAKELILYALEDAYPCKK